MVWESAERTSLERFVAALDNPNVRPTTYLSLQVAPLLAGHWSVTGQGFPIRMRRMNRCISPAGTFC